MPLLTDAWIWSWVWIPFGLMTGKLPGCPAVMGIWCNDWRQNCDSELAALQEWMMRRVFPGRWDWFRREFLYQGCKCQRSDEDAVSISDPGINQIHLHFSLSLSLSLSLCLVFYSALFRPALTTLTNHIPYPEMPPIGPYMVLSLCPNWLVVFIIPCLIGLQQIVLSLFILCLIGRCGCRRTMCVHCSLCTL